MPFTILAAKLIPVSFTVNNATPTVPGDYIFLTGDTVEVGNWNTTWDSAVGPMLTPNYPNWFLNVSVPAGHTIQFKFVKIAANGAVTLGRRCESLLYGSHEWYRLCQCELAELSSES